MTDQKEGNDQDLSVSDRILQFLVVFPVVVSLICLLWWGTFWIVRTMIMWMKEFQ